jgi:hypothetical protein
MGQDSPASINLNDPDNVFVEESVIPIPLEVFASLDKIGAQDWGGQVDERAIQLDANRSRTAMLFGLVVSEGFIAVQAKDKEAVSRIGREVLRLSQSLGVASSVEEHANSIVDAAGRSDWERVRGELDKTRQTVINKMKELRDDELVALVSLGGWLGGTEALASVLRQNYTVEGSDLLNQPDLVKRLKTDFNGLPKRARRGKVFTQVSQTLEHLESLMRVDGSGAISEGNVIEISLATKNLVDAIYERSSPGSVCGQEKEISAVEAAERERAINDVKLLAQKAALPALRGDDKFILRESWWSGRISPGKAKLIQVQLFRRNAYRFWLAVAQRDAELNLNVYDSDGKLVPSETVAFEESNVVGTKLVPELTGVYYVLISLKTTIDQEQDWAVIYAYR